MKRYKVFLASSAELSLERKEIALMIHRANNAWTEKDVYVELVVWEDLLHSFRGERIQDYFNKQMLKCDIRVSMTLYHNSVKLYLASMTLYHNSVKLYRVSMTLHQDLIRL